MTSAQFAEWAAFFELEPWGSLRRDYLFGLLMATVSNVAPFRGKGARTWRPADFLATLKLPEQTPRQMARLARGVAVGMGGRVVTVAEFNATIAKPRA